MTDTTELDKALHDFWATDTGSPEYTETREAIRALFAAKDAACRECGTYEGHMNSCSYNASSPESCYRVRCQLSKTCVDPVPAVSRAAVLEQAAKICDDYARSCDQFDMESFCAGGAKDCAAAIRRAAEQERT